MKKHIVPITLLLIALIAFCFGFLLSGAGKIVCDIVVFIFSSGAAVAEMILSERNTKKFEDELKKRPPVEIISEEEYKRREVEGSIDAGTIYATTEE